MTAPPAPNDDESDPTGLATGSLDDDRELATLLGELARTPGPPVAGRVGQTLGRYRIEGVLGQGGMGVVYRAWDPELERAVALKVLPPSRAHDAQADQRLAQEARAAARFVHPHIATVYDVFGGDGQLCVAMELVEGEPLSVRLRRGPLRDDEVVRVARGVAQALAAAHRERLVHRDLKPGNILVTPGGEPKVLDFGLARRLDQRAGVTESGALVGTPQYMAPEQAAGRPVDERTDVFAFGAVLYELLTGRRPFGGEGALEILAAIQRDTPPAAADLAPRRPAHLLALADRCLKRAPDERPPDGEALLAALEAPPAPRGRPALVAGLTLTSLVLLGAGVALFDRVTEPALPPSLASVPTLTDDPHLQRTFVRAAEALYAGDREASARALEELVDAGVDHPLAAALWLFTDDELAAFRRDTVLLPTLERAAGESTPDGAVARLVLLSRKRSRLSPDVPLRAEDLVEAARARDVILAAEGPDYLRRLVAAFFLPPGVSPPGRLELLQELRTVDDSAPFLYLALFWTWLHLGDTARAQAVLDEGLARHPTSYFLELEQAMARIDGGRLEEAVPLLERLVKRRPASVPPRFALAEADLLLGSDARWPGELDRLLSGSFPPVLVGRGTLLFTEAVSARGRVAQARPFRERALALLIDAGAWAEAAAGVGRLLQEAWENRAAAELQRWMGAAETIAQAPELEDESRRRLLTALLLARGRLALLEDRAPDARALRDRLDGLDEVSFPPPGRASTSALFDAELAALAGDEPTTRAALERADPPSAAARFGARPVDLDAGQLLERLGHPGEAAAAYRRVVAAREGCTKETLFWLVRCRRDLGLALAGLTRTDDEGRAEHARALAELMPRADPGLPYPPPRGAP